MFTSQVHTQLPTGQFEHFEHSDEFGDVLMRDDIMVMMSVGMLECSKSCSVSE